MSFPRYVGLRISTQAGAVPTASDMSEGELAFNVADERIFTLFGSTVVEITDTYTQSEIDSLLSGKVDKVAGKGLSTEDYTTEDHDKLAGIESGATADQTKADIDALDVDADTVDGKHAADFDPAGSAATVEQNIRDTLRQRPDPLLMHFL